MPSARATGRLPIGEVLAKIPTGPLVGRQPDEPVPQPRVTRMPSRDTAWGRASVTGVAMMAAIAMVVAMPGGQAVAAPVTPPSSAPVVAPAVAPAVTRTPPARPVAAEANRFTNRELTEGFMRTVFGLEYRSWSWKPYLVKKYTSPVRFYVHNLSHIDRRAAAHRFLLSLQSKVDGLSVSLARTEDTANFQIFIVDRAQYSDIVRSRIYDDVGATAPGRCLVRVISDNHGITGSWAAIVSDEGEFLFRRCLVEEVLQGLGPMNDDESLEHSVFNDTSRHARFMLFDRYILNMLYDRRIRPGMRPEATLDLLPSVIRDARRKVN